MQIFKSCETIILKRLNLVMLSNNYIWVLKTFLFLNHRLFQLLTIPCCVSVKPQTVNILTKERQVSADKRYEVECRTTGSRPDAVITWWKGSRPVKRLAKNVSRLSVQLRGFCFIQLGPCNKSLCRKGRNFFSLSIITPLGWRTKRPFTLHFIIELHLPKRAKFLCVWRALVFWKVRCHCSV